MKNFLKTFLLLALLLNPCVSFGDTPIYGDEQEYTTYKQQAAKPSSPNTGYNRLYFLDDGVLYYVDSSGNQTEVGSGSGSGISVATAGGTADVITADFSPDVTLADKTLVAIVALAANATATPTFAPDGLTAHTIVKKGGSALVVGDIPGQYAVCLLEYNLANTRWELLNPAVPQTSITGNAGTASALAADPANCTAGNAPLGVTAAGAAEGCFAVQADMGITAISDSTSLTSSTTAASSTGLKSVQDSKAPIASPTFTGIVTSPTYAATGAVTYSPLSVSGAQFRINAATITDAFTPGARAVGAASSFGIPTFASDGNSITVTDAATVYIAGVPVDGGANMELTNTYSLLAVGAAKIDGALTATGALSAASLTGTAISDSTSTTSSTVAASSTAAKSAYDLAGAAIPKSLVTEQGDIIYASAASTPAALAHGTAGQLLRSGGNAANPAWSTNVFPNTGTAFYLPVFTSANTMGELAASGTDGQILTAVTGAIPVWSSTLSIATLDMTLATSSIPWPVTTATGAQTVAGQVHFESDTFILSIGDGTSRISLDFAAQQTYTFPTTSATLARTDAGNTFTGHQTMEGVTATGATGTGKHVYDTAPTLLSAVLTTPKINGLEKVVSQDTVLTADECFGRRINNYGQVANATVTLPTPEADMDLIFSMGTASPVSFTVNAAVSFTVYASGTNASNGVKTTPVKGDYFVFYTFKTGASTWEWIAKSGQGTLTAY